MLWLTLLHFDTSGGSVQAGLAIFDTMQYIPCDVNTVCFGMAASMGAFLLSSGTPGKRRSLPNSRIMIHQPLGGSQGEATDLEITARLMLHTKETLNTYMAAFCDQVCMYDFIATPSMWRWFRLVGLISPCDTLQSYPSPPPQDLLLPLFHTTSSHSYVYLFFFFPSYIILILI